MFIGLVVLRQ